MAFRDCTFDIGGFRLRGRRWGAAGGRAVLALHGWLDNCASFDFLAQRLPQLDLVTLDLAGHGLSDHRNHPGAYNIWQDVGDVFAVADQLGWSQFGLIGHSRGAIISMLAAGTLPERVGHLGLLDGVLPQVAPAEQTPETLASSIAAVRQQLERSRRYYSTFDEAVSARQRGMFNLSRDDAEALARRGVEQTSRGYAWLYDNKLMAPSEIRLTPEQAESFFNRIRARMLLVLARDSFLQELDTLQAWLKRHEEQLPRVLVKGDHHCHMSAGAEEVASALEQGLGFQPGGRAI